MSKKTIWLTKETRKGLKKIDNYLANQPWRPDKLDMDTVLKLREMITDIEDRGYYTFEQKDILNIIREGIITEKNVTD